jgi:hypothetical protein
VPGQACTPSNPCFGAATMTCSAGPVCITTPGSELPYGTSCGTNRVCDGAGACVCDAGAACTPTDPCFTAGTTDCTGGIPACTGTVPLCPDGTTCNAGVCGG